MLYISVVLGLIFFVAGLIALYIGISASTPVARTASRQRRKEGDYASAITEELDYGGQDLQLEEINSSSARKEVRTTKIIAISSLYVHVVLAAAVGLALWFGANGVKAGHIAPGELFLFIAYALTVHRRMVQVGRQSARTGKVLACADRIGAFLRNVGSTEVPASRPHVFVPLKTGLRLDHVKLTSLHGREARARLRSTDLVIQPETSVAVLGNIGSGKSSLLHLLAGAEFPDKGNIYWDDIDVSSCEDGLSSRVAYLPQDPVFPPIHLWKLIGLKGPVELTADQEETLGNIEALKVVKSFPKGLTKKVGLTSLSRNEARLLRLAGLLIGDTSSVWVFDNPVQGLRHKKAERCLDEIMKCASGRTVVLSLTEPVRLKSFDRVLDMGGGKVRFDGTPAEWEEWRRSQKVKSVNVPGL
jgi:ABC-type bacteriocin/lantibiotic exporter with double-glycine peptidase domain